MTNTHLKIAESYYLALNNKDLKAINNYIHPKISFLSPLSQTTGKDSFIVGAEMYFEFFKTITVQEKFCLDDKVMLVYDIDSAESSKILRVASLITFKDGLIYFIELLYDPRSFEKKRNEMLGK